MTAGTCTLLTIVTEAGLEKRLIADLKRLGAPGYTITDARGEGARGVRDAGWSASGNIRVEVVCDASTAQRLSEHLQRHYYQDYAIIVFAVPVTVTRAEKFGSVGKDSSLSNSD